MQRGQLRVHGRDGHVGPCVQRVHGVQRGCAVRDEGVYAWLDHLGRPQSAVRGLHGVCILFPCFVIDKSVPYLGWHPRKKRVARWHNVPTHLVSHRPADVVARVLHAF